MAFGYEPGPVQPLDPSAFPRAGQIRAEMESLVAPVAAELHAGDDAIGARASEIAGAGIPTVDADAAAILGPAVREIGRQTGEAHTLSLSPVVAALGGSLGEVDRVKADLPVEDSSFEPPPVPGEGTDDFPTSTDPRALAEGPEETPLI